MSTTRVTGPVAAVLDRADWSGFAPVLAAFAAAILALFVLVPGIGRAPFDDPGEGQHAEIAREAYLTGDWLGLRLNGVRYFDKPPLYYWLAAGSFGLFGQGELAGRLPSLLGAALALAATALLGTRLLGFGGGLAAAGALLSCALFAAFARYMRPETLFAAAIQWGMTGVLLALADDTAPRSRPRWLVAGCVALGVAALAKDVLGLLGPVTAVIVALLLARRLRPPRGRAEWLAVTVLAVVGFGWYALATLRSPGFLWYTVVDNHVLNLVGLRRFPDEDVPLTSAEFLTVGSLGAFPWIVPAVLEIGALARRRAWRARRELPWVALGLWVVGLLLLFTASRFKLPHYAVPAYPAIALLAIRWWREHAGRARRVIALHLAAFALLAAVLALAAGGEGRLFSDAVFSATDVETRKAETAGQPSPVPPWSALEPLVRHAAWVFAAGGTVLVVALVRGAGTLGLVTVLATMLAVVPDVAAGVATVASTRAVAGLAGELRAGMRPDDVLVHEGPIENSGALEFYSGRRPVLVDARRSVLGIGATFPDSSGAFWDGPRLAEVWQSSRRVFLITPRAPFRSLVAGLPRDRVYLIDSRGGRWLYSNTATGNRHARAPGPE